MKVLVIGGKGMISRQIVNQLLIANHEVTIFDKDTASTTSRTEVRQISGDKFRRHEFESSMRKEKFDVVIDMLCFNKEDAISVINAFRDNIEQLIITSSVAAYNRPTNSMPIREESEELNKQSLWAYGIQKADVERYLAEVTKNENYPITIVRPSITYGVGAVNVGVLRQNYGIVDRIRKGKPLVMFGDGKTPWSFTFAPDLAKGFVSLVGQKKAYGEAFHVSNEDKRVWEDLYLEFGKILGIEPNIVYIPSSILYKAAPSLCDHIYFEKCYAGLYDNSKMRTINPGYRASIALNEGLQMLLEYFERDNPVVEPRKDKLEDDLASLYSIWSEKAHNLYV